MSSTVTGPERGDGRRHVHARRIERLRTVLGECCRTSDEERLLTDIHHNPIRLDAGSAQGGCNPFAVAAGLIRSRCAEVLRALRHPELVGDEHGQCRRSGQASTLGTKRAEKDSALYSSVRSRDGTHSSSCSASVPVGLRRRMDSAVRTNSSSMRQPEEEAGNGHVLDLPCAPVDGHSSREQVILLPGTHVGYVGSQHQIGP